jgi:hypothetical protein
MSAQIVYGIFDDTFDAAEAVDQLKRDGIPARSISIAGPDRGELRPVTSHLINSRRIDPFIVFTVIAGGALGFLLGCLTFLIPAISANTFGQIMAAISAGSAGAYLGLLAGAIAHFDSPTMEGEVYEMQVNRGNVMLAVNTDESHFREVETVLQTKGAVEVDRRIAA